MRRSRNQEMQNIKNKNELLCYETEKIVLRKKSMDKYSSLVNYCCDFRCGNCGSNLVDVSAMMKHYQAYIILENIFFMSMKNKT